LEQKRKRGIGAMFYGQRSVNSRQSVVLKVTATATTTTNCPWMPECLTSLYTKHILSEWGSKLALSTHKTDAE